MCLLEWKQEMGSVLVVREIRVHTTVHNKMLKLENGPVLLCSFTHGFV